MTKLNQFHLLTVAFSVVLMIASACQPTNQPAANESDSMHQHEEHHAMEKGKEITKAVCVLHPTEGNEVKGVITFEKVDNGIRVTANVSGLTEGKHGFHAHEFGDCSAPDGTSAGGHFNPAGTAHGGPHGDHRHAGDFGNLEADAQGNATYDRVDEVIELNGSQSIIGYAIIVHAEEDDLVSQPTGAAGARVACGVIGVAQ